MAQLKPAHRDVLMGNPWFAELPAEVRAAIEQRAMPRALAAGERLFSRGDAGHTFFAVLEGSVRISGTSKEGREALLTFYEPGHWFGEISLIDNLRRTHDASAHTASVLLALDKSDFEDLLAQYAAFSRSLLRLECERLRAISLAMEAHSTMSLEQRFAGRLLALAHAYGSNTARGLSIELHLSQEVLAQLLGVTRQRVNQVLKGWETEGLIEQSYGRVLLTDRQRLEALAQG